MMQLHSPPQNNMIGDDVSDNHMPAPNIITTVPANLIHTDLSNTQIFYFEPTGNVHDPPLSVDRTDSISNQIFYFEPTNAGQIVHNSTMTSIQSPPNIIVDGENIITREISLFEQRIKRFDFLFVYIVILLVDILFLLSYIPGTYSTWYNSLIQPDLNPWIPRAGWIIATILSYIGIYILWEYAGPDDIPRDLGVSVLFIVANFITVAWSVALYQGENIGLATWISVVLFVFQLWLVIYVWYIKPLAAVFLIPLMLMYLYLVYSMVHLAAINNVIL